MSSRWEGTGLRPTSPNRCNLCGDDLIPDDNWTGWYLKNNRRVCKTCQVDRCRQWKIDTNYKKTPARLVEPLDPVIAEVRHRHQKALNKLTNQHTGVKEGFVYVITNEAWPGYVKIGSAVDPIHRCNSYQTGSPLRDYRLEHYAYSLDRKMLERSVHKRLIRFRVKGEWFTLPITKVIECIRHEKTNLETTTGNPSPVL